MNRHSSQGFVLVLVLAMLVILSLLAGAVATTTTRLRDQSQARQVEMQDKIDIASTRATVLYLINTQRMTLGGLTVDNSVSFGESGMRPIESESDLESGLPLGTEIAMDGRSHRGLRAIRFSLQDDRGLFAVNWIAADELRRLLLQGKKPADTPAEVLINRLLDYQDPDDLYRLGSMEAEGYRSAGMPLPTNRRLSTPMELMRVIGWKEALAFLQPSELGDTISLENTPDTNVNTAPARVLMTLPGMTPELVERAMARRKIQPFLTGVAFFDFLGIAMPADASIGVYPAPSGTLKLWSANGGQVDVVHWALTPAEEGQPPWREDYELIQSQSPLQNELVYPVRSRLFGQQVAAGK